MRYSGMRWVWLVVVWLGGPSLVEGVEPEPVTHHVSRPSFKYDDKGLALSLFADKAQTALIQWTPIDDSGRLRTGQTKRRSVSLAIGRNDIALPVGDNGAHRVTFKLNGTKHRIITNKGNWFSTPRDIFVTLVQPAANGTAFPHDDHGFTVLGRDYGVETTRPLDPPAPLTVGRTFGYESASGIPLEQGERALLLDAEGNVGAVVITIGQRVGKEKILYYDYHMVLDAVMRRYVIPFTAFDRRGGHQTSLLSIHSIAIRSLNKADVGWRMVVKNLGLTLRNPTISKINRNRRGVTFHVRSPRAYRGAVFYRTQRGDVAKLTGRGGRIPAFKKAKSVWLCTDTGICDPADAPHTAYAVPPPSDKPYVIDAFDTRAQVNALRQPVSVYGSSEAVERRMTFERGGDTLKLRFGPLNPDDYAGYLTPLPDEWSSRYQTITVSLRGRAPAGAVLLGLKGSTGREGRIPLSAYLTTGPRGGGGGASAVALDDEFREVSVPVAAFRAVVESAYLKNAKLGKPSHFFVTTTASADMSEREIELDTVRLDTSRVPITVARFDRIDQKKVTDLGSVIYIETKNGGAITVDYDEAGYRGHGLRMTAKSPRPEGYALAALGTSNVDVSRYKRLSFRVRGRDGDEQVAIYLNDGKKRAMVNLSDLLRVGKKWRRVEIPLSLFKKKKINLKRVFQIIFAFENRTIEEEVLWLDDVVFE